MKIVVLAMSLFLSGCFLDSLWDSNDNSDKNNGEVTKEYKAPEPKPPTKKVCK